MNSLSGIRLGFFGTPDFALEVLKSLCKDSAEIKFVVTQSPRPSGRGQKENFSKVHQWTNSREIKTFTTDKTNKFFYETFIKKIEVDFIVVVAYGQIINESILKHPKFMSLNVHASLLPRWRGAAPIQRAILNGDSKTGISIMRVDQKLDSGPVIIKKELKINKSDNAGTLHSKLESIGAELIKESIKKIYSNDFKLHFQNEDDTTYAKKIDKSETRINWKKSAQYNERFIRAFNPWPGAWSIMHTEREFRVKILDSEIIKYKKLFPKTLEEGVCDENLIVKCGDGFLKIRKIQKEGKKIMNADEFINGYKIKTCFLK